MKKTSNLGLNLPEQEDFYNVDDFNENTEKLDEALDGLRRDAATYDDLFNIIDGLRRDAVTYDDLFNIIVENYDD